MGKYTASASERQRKRREAAQADGVTCVKCANRERSPGRKNCQVCLDYAKAYLARRRDEPTEPPMPRAEVDAICRRAVARFLAGESPRYYEGEI